jgi:hypothetical protein
MTRSITKRLTYSNVMATVAVFIALGGSSYALTRNSVGAAELRSNSVGKSEIRRSAVGSSEIDNRSIRLQDMSLSSRRSLRGQVGPIGPQGPPGPTFSATVNSTGGPVRGNATFTEPVGVAGTTVGFGRSVAGCVATATVTTAPGGPASDTNGHATIQDANGGRLFVQTWDRTGTPERFAFNLIVAC